MSDFLLVVPEGWVELDWQYITNNVPGMSASQVIGWINGGGMTDIDSALKGAGVIPSDKTVVEAKLIDDAYFMVKLG